MFNIFFHKHKYIAFFRSHLYTTTEDLYSHIGGHLNSISIVKKLNQL